MSKKASYGKIAILGGGNLGRALARGWARYGGHPPDTIWVTRRLSNRLEEMKDEGFATGADNRSAVQASQTIVVAVQPKQVDALLEEIRSELDPALHQVISVVSGVSIESLRSRLDEHISIVRAMPNTAVSIGQSMTCLAADEGSQNALEEAERLFAHLGKTLTVGESMMTAATALCACGVAFFLRCVRAASQGGIEIGFHPEEALLLAAQTARGSASLLLEREGHPEREIDRVTTPRGCTIAGLNELEHRGFSSALIRGIVVSADKAESLAD